MGRFKNQMFFTDRTGRDHNREQMQVFFSRIYPENPAALSLMFPDMNHETVRYYAKVFGATKSHRLWQPEETALCRSLWPDYAKIAEATGRDLSAIRKYCRRIGLKQKTIGRYTDEEAATLLAGKLPTTRSRKSAYKECQRRGLKLRHVRAVQALSIDQLTIRVSTLAGLYRPDRRADIIQSVLTECLAGRHAVDVSALKAAVQKAATATYKLHPDRGAPVSLDAKLFDDGGTTVGDRIASDTFHF